MNQPEQIQIDAARYQYLRQHWEEWTGNSWMGTPSEVAAKLDAAIDAVRPPTHAPQGQAVEAAYNRVREEFEIVARAGTSACIDSAMLNVDALISHFAPPAAPDAPAGVACFQATGEATADLNRPPIGAMIHVVGLVDEAIKVTGYTARGFTYSGAKPLDIPRLGIWGDGTGEVYLDNDRVSWRFAALPSQQPKEDGK